MEKASKIIVGIKARNQDKCRCIMGGRGKVSLSVMIEGSLEVGNALYTEKPSPCNWCSC